MVRIHFLYGKGDAKLREVVMSSFQKEKDEVCKELEKVDGQIEA
jgi:hypothetical protein